MNEEVFKREEAGTHTAAQRRAALWAHRLRRAIRNISFALALVFLLLYIPGHYGAFSAGRPWIDAQQRRHLHALLIGYGGISLRNMRIHDATNALPTVWEMRIFATRADVPAMWNLGDPDESDFGLRQSAVMIDGASKTICPFWLLSAFFGALGISASGSRTLRDRCLWVALIFTATLLILLLSLQLFDAPSFYCFSMGGPVNNDGGTRWLELNHGELALTEIKMLYIDFPPPFDKPVFRVGPLHIDRGINGWQATTPLWIPIAFLSLIVAALATHFVRGWWRERRMRLYPHLCRGCGYDLRATPGRCPECGRVAAGGVLAP